ncbi:MAG: carboxypeptidase regulatory-like domain-containing protein [Muribaculaceae bacterium]|nr:carboxypeptidase regulatory-like domain-containing protein [Muribaculaceae bacterium]
MRLKLFILLWLLACMPALAQHTGLRGVLVDAKTNAPVAGAIVILDGQGTTVTSGPEGDFLITEARPGSDVLLVLTYGYKDLSRSVTITAGVVDDLGTLRVEPSYVGTQDLQDFNTEQALTEAQLEDEEGNSQAVGLLMGTSDNPFYQAASYRFSVMRFRIRGYNNEYSNTSINGINFNDAVRGRFNYSMTGGLNQAFRNKAIAMGLEAASFDFGNIGGTTNISTYAKDFAPGLRASVAYTNGNYQWRGMVTYSTGVMNNGWALAGSAVVRYAGEGIIPGSFYNSVGYFLSAQKTFNPHHSLNITTFGAPTRRASNTAVVQEAYDLAGTNLYNPNWGWQDGRKRNARVVEAFDPTILVNWIWKPDMHTTLNTGAAFHKSFYASSALNWNDAPDPRPDYYRYLPSYFGDTPGYAVYYDLWTGGDDIRQINWDRLYQVNQLNNYEADQRGTERGATYMLGNRHSNQASWALGTNLNKRLTDVTTLQGGVSANFTRSSYYQTVKDLLGGRFWTDVDQYAERDFPDNAQMAQNDLNNPNRRVVEGDRFGYDYNIDSWQGRIWKQMVFTTARWDVTYALQATYTRFQRDGKMRNGRAPENSYGRGLKHEFVNAAFKAGATYKLDGRNNFVAHIYYGTHAPLPTNAYISPRTKDDVIADLHSEAIWSGDLSYNWNYRRFKGSLTGFYTDQRGATERTGYYDDQYKTFMNYALTGVHKVYKGLELGLSYKLTPSITLSGAATFSRYQYKNRPTGTRSYENGTQEDITTTVYLKNYYVSGTPQEAYSAAINWAAPKNWYFELSGTWLGKAYIDMSPIRHEVIPTLYTQASSEEHLLGMARYLADQEKLNDAFTLDASIGHVIYIKRRYSVNINLNLNNILNNTKIMTGGYQQGRQTYNSKTGEFDFGTFASGKYPNKYYYAQGFKLFLNLGFRF